MTSSTIEESSPEDLNQDKPKSIGMLTATFLVVANMIGSGVFTGSGYSLGGLGSPVYVWFAWLVGGIIALTGAVCYGALGKHYRRSGGEYLFLTHTIHPAIGFIAGWVSLVAGFTGAIAFSAQAFASYFLPLINPSWNAKENQSLFLYTAIALILIAAAAHSFQFRLGVFAQNFFVGLKLILLTVLIGIALLAPTVPFTKQVAFDFGTFAVSVMYISFSYIGYNAVVYAASEVRNVERTLPLATILGTLLVTLIYLVLNYVFLFKVPVEMTTNQYDIAAICAGYVGGDTLEVLVRVIISMATTTSVFAMVMLGPRVFALMAQDGWMPAKLNNGSSPLALFVQAGFAAMVVYVFTKFANASDLLLYLGLTLSLSSALSACALFVLKAKGESIDVPLWPWPPILFIGATFGLIITAAIVQPIQVAFAIGVVTIGLAAYAILQKFRTSKS